MSDRVLSVVGRAPDQTASVWDLDVHDGMLVLSTSADLDMHASVAVIDTASLLAQLSEGLHVLDENGWTFDAELPLSWKSLRPHPLLAPVFWDAAVRDAERVLEEDLALEAVAFSLSATGIRPTFVAEGAEAAFARQLNAGMVALALHCQEAMVRIDRDGVHIAEGEVGDAPSRRTRRRVTGR